MEVLNALKQSSAIREDAVLFTFYSDLCFICCACCKLYIVLCAWRIIILCTACLNVWWRIIPPVFHPLGTATSLSLAAVCEPQMIETLHENDVDAILITILILCKSTEVYRRAPRPPDPRWWEQEGPTSLTLVTHPND